MSEEPHPLEYIATDETSSYSDQQREDSQSDEIEEDLDWEWDLRFLIGVRIVS